MKSMSEEVSDRKKQQGVHLLSLIVSLIHWNMKWQWFHATDRAAPAVTACFPSTVTSGVTNETVSRYDRLLAHFLPGIGLISDLKQRGRRPSSSLEQRGVDHNINNILQLEITKTLSLDSTK